MYASSLRRCFFIEDECNLSDTKVIVKDKISTCALIVRHNNVSHRQVERHNMRASVLMLPG